MYTSISFVIFVLTIINKINGEENTNTIIHYDEGENVKFNCDVKHNQCIEWEKSSLKNNKSYTIKTPPFCHHNNTELYAGLKFTIKFYNATMIPTDQMYRSVYEVYDINKEDNGKKYCCLTGDNKECFTLSLSSEKWSFNEKYNIYKFYSYSITILSIIIVLIGILYIITIRCKLRAEKRNMAV